jgi:hypothetical protein
LKKTSLYILIAAVVLLIVAAFMLYKPDKGFDKKVTFSRKETRPYATSICYTTLSSLFNNCKQQLNRDAPYEWANFDSTKDGGQLFFVLSREFNPSKEELDWLNSFVSNGNFVFICAANWNYVSKEYFNLKIEDSPTDISYYIDYKDSVNTTLKSPFYKPALTYFNAGYTYSNYFKELDSTKFATLGVENNIKPNFIKGSVKKGAFYFHTDPFLFCNYFITQKNNSDYYQKAISAIPNNVNKIIWDEYYTYKKDDEKKETRSPFRILFSYPAFLWAFGVSILLLVIYFIINYKRKQRFIPAQSILKNDSLYFAETIGRLYFDKGDHANLAKKMAAYFLEHIRSKYFINTSQLNNELVHKLSSKSGYNEELCFQLIQTIVDIQVQTNINQQQLNKYYLIFQNFYKQTT